MFCPSNFNAINIGDSMAQVEAQCGKPANQKSTKEDSNVPQEWTYYIAAPSDPLTSYGTVKLTLAFVGGKVVNISSGGYSVGATTVCGGNTVQMGTSLKDVKKACGQPTMVNKATPQPGAAQPDATELTEWSYASTPPVTLKFENGKLVSRE
jgi:hypothetical protein